MANLKKMLLILLAFTLVFSLASCSLIDKITGKDDDKDKGKVCRHEDDDGDCYCDKCNETMHEDEDEDGFCDYCDENLDKKGDSSSGNEIELILDGEATFQIVLDKTLSRNAQNQIKSLLVAPLLEFDVEVSFVIEDSDDDEEADVEILIGQVKNRGEDYEYDKHSLGKDGYAFKIVDSKVLISAGSDEKIVDAVAEFAEYVLLLGEDALEDVTMTSDDEIEEIQDDYRITSLMVGDTDIRGYTLAVDTKNEYMVTGALYIQDVFYDRAGYWFEIVDIKDADDESIILRTVNKIFNSENSFKIYADDTQLFIDCAFDVQCERALMKFVNAKIVNAPKGDFVFEDVVYKQDISYVTYEDFGAMGNGKTDDFQAIWETHNFANKAGLTVKATNGKKYLMSSSTFQADGEFAETIHTVEIRTNVDWGTAEFVIDDRDIGLYKGQDRNGEASKAVFKVLPNYGDETFQFKSTSVFNDLIAAGINPTTKKIDYDFLSNWDGPVMITLYNSSHKVYRRRGYSSFMGLQTHEVIVLDKDGNVDPSTPIMFYYDKIDYINVHKLDESTAITIQGGTFTTRSNKTNIFGFDATTQKYRNDAGPSVERNITVARSYTTVKNVKHYVTDQMTVSEQFELGKLPGIENKLVLTNGETTYAGFFSADEASYITFDSCILTGRRGYQRPAADGSGGGGMGGTYDLAVNNANAVTYKDCNQHNFWITIDSNYNVIPATEDTPGAVTSMQSVTVNGCSFRMHWGIGGTNFSKNIVYDGSTLSRYDAHAGLYNGKVIDSTVNYLALTGNGEFIVENTKWIYTGETENIISLRSDYGCTWDGDVTIKNVTAYITSKAEGVQVCGYGYKNWYYGYIVGFPTLTIDNLKVYNMDTKSYEQAGFEMRVTSIANNSTDTDVPQNEARMHLAVSHMFPVIPIYDGDKDGYIDELPIDIDGDGIVDPVFDIDGNGIAGKTALKYDVELAAAGSAWESGVKLRTVETFYNLNIVKPPKYIKIINNEAGYVYKFPRTDGAGTPNGAWYGVKEDNNGGFFGCTKFYYGPGEDDYVVGTKAGYDQNIPNYEFYLG